MLKGTPRIKLKIMCCQVKNVKILKIGSRNNNFEMVYVTEHIIRIMAFLENINVLVEICSVDIWPETLCHNINPKHSLS